MVGSWFLIHQYPTMGIHQPICSMVLVYWPTWLGDFVPANVGVPIPAPWFAYGQVWQLEIFDRTKLAEDEILGIQNYIWYTWWFIYDTLFIEDEDLCTVFILIFKSLFKYNIHIYHQYLYKIRIYISQILYPKLYKVI